MNNTKVKLSDFDDIRQHLGTEEVKRQILEKLKNFGSSSDGRKTTFTLGEVLNLPRPSFLVQGIIPQNGLGSITGATGSYKSFVAVRIALHSALGEIWCDRAVKRTNVLYVAGEGLYGLRQRFRAAMIDQGTKSPPDNLHIRSGLNLMDDGDLECITGFIEDHEVGLLILDTFARSFVGDENSSKDMSEAINRLDRAATRNGCAVMLVHHTGHGNTDRARGSSAFRAALDFEIGVQKEDTGITVKCWKAKDCEPFEDFFMTPRTVDTGERDDYGNPVTSLVLDQVTPPKKEVVMTAEQQRVADHILSMDSPFSHERLERETYPLIKDKHKGRFVSKLLDKMTNSGAIAIAGNMYFIDSNRKT